MHFRCLSSILIGLACAWALVLVPAAGICAENRALTAEELAYITQHLTTAGCSADVVTQLLAESGLQYLPGMVSMNVVQKDYSHNYRKFLEPDSIDSAWQYARHWRTRLAATERTFGVDRYIIVAILLVETRLGNYTGTVHVLSSYVSILLENRPQQRERRTAQLTDARKRTRYLTRLTRKARWATAELTTLVSLHQEQLLDATRLRGSFAGAFGLCQFLPSSYRQWAHTGNGSGGADLFWPPHAFSSIANYLCAHGWKPGLDEAAKHKILWHYNHLNVYAKTVLEVADALHARAAADDTTLTKSRPIPPAH